eukprot:GEMP01089504.1.p1 GENE.GEMP01089504.1~~GEMP01089504.1.p1  ORF type:complete len:190 (+),score=42.73 GEMP01089504.1:169-738(+)
MARSTMHVATSFFDTASDEQCRDCCMPTVSSCSASITAQDYSRALKGFKVNAQYAKCVDVNCAHETSGCGWVARDALEENWTGPSRGIPDHLPRCMPCRKLLGNGDTSHIVGCRSWLQSIKQARAAVSLQPQLTSYPPRFAFWGGDAPTPVVPRGALRYPVVHDDAFFPHIRASVLRDTLFSTRKAISI